MKNWFFEKINKDKPPTRVISRRGKRTQTDKTCDGMRENHKNIEKIQRLLGT